MVGWFACARLFDVVDDLHPAVTAAEELTAQCRAKFRFPRTWRLKGLCDSHAEYEVELISRHPSEFSGTMQFELMFGTLLLPTCQVVVHLLFACVVSVLAGLALGWLWAAMP